MKNFIILFGFIIVVLLIVSSNGDYRSSRGYYHHWYGNQSNLSDDFIYPSDCIKSGSSDTNYDSAVKKDYCSWLLTEIKDDQNKRKNLRYTVNWIVPIVLLVSFVIGIIVLLEDKQKLIFKPKEFELEMPTSIVVVLMMLLLNALLVWFYLSIY